MTPRLNELLDLQKIAALFDSLYLSTGISCAIADPEGELLATSGWNSICMNFYGAHPETKSNCNIKNLHRQEYIGAESQRISSHHGLVYAISPLIIDGKRLGSIVMGQVFLEKPDIAFFKEQALLFGFDEADFIAAV